MNEHQAPAPPSSVDTGAPVSRRDRRRVATQEKHNPTPKAGRNLYAAIGVGVGLGIMCIIALFVRKEAFVLVATGASVIGTWELMRAMSQRSIAPPTIPTLGAALVIPPIAYFWGPQALINAVVAAFAVVMVWRAVRIDRGAAADVASGILAIVYVPTLVSFAMLLLAFDDGPWRIVVFILTTIASDIGGYAFGVLKGKHPMAPSVSPKKSWEGFAGSVLCTVVVGAVTVHLCLDGRWWVGALMGGCVVLAATIGDLCESMIKRDLGIKDMSNLIPGHGGLMDRLDSLLIAVPVVWAILTPFVAVAA